MCTSVHWCKVPLHQCRVRAGVCACAWVCIGARWGLGLSVHRCKANAGCVCARVCIRARVTLGHASVRVRVCISAAWGACVRKHASTHAHSLCVCVCVYTHTRVQAAHGAAPVPPGALVLLLSPLSPHARVHGSSHALAHPCTPAHALARPSRALSPTNSHFSV